jgi:AcrR family transcriptional regulator
MTTARPQYENYENFTKAFPINADNLYREFYLHFRDDIQIQKEDTAVRNLEVILNATFKLSSRKGFHAMSLRDLSQETKISMGGLYKYIQSKDKLADMIEEFAGGRIAMQLQEIVEEVPDHDERVNTIIRLFVYMVQLFQPWYFFMFMEAKNLSRDNRIKAMNYELQSTQRLERVIRARQIHHQASLENISLTSSTLMATMEAWYLKHWHYQEQGISIDDYADYCVALTRKLL